VHCDEVLDVGPRRQRQSLRATQPDPEHSTQAVVLCRSASEIMSKDAAHAETMSARVVIEYRRRRGVPVFTVATKAEGCIEGIVGGDWTDAFASLPFSAELRKLLVDVARRHDAAFEHTFATVALDNLRVSLSANPLDQREGMVLSVVLACASSIATAARLHGRPPIDDPPADAANAAQPQARPKPLLYSTAAQLADHFKDMPSVREAIVRNGIDGRCLARMTPAQIDRVFGGADSGAPFGDIDRVQRTAEAYHALAVDPAPQRTVSAWLATAGGDAPSSAADIVAGLLRAPRASSKARFVFGAAMITADGLTAVNGPEGHVAVLGSHLAPSGGTVRLRPTFPGSTWMFLGVRNGNHGPLTAGGFDDPAAFGFIAGEHNHLFIAGVNHPGHGGFPANNTVSGDVIELSWTATAVSFRNETRNTGPWSIALPAAHPTGFHLLVGFRGASNSVQILP